MGTELRSQALLTIRTSPALLSGYRWALTVPGNEAWTSALSGSHRTARRSAMGISTGRCSRSAGHSFLRNEGGAPKNKPHDEVVDG